MTRHGEQQRLAGWLSLLVVGAVMFGTSAGCSDSTSAQQPAGQDGGAQDGAVQDGAVQDGAVLHPDGDVKDGDVKDGDVKDSDASDGSPEAGSCPADRPPRVVWARTNKNLMPDPDFKDGKQWLHIVHGVYKANAQPLFDPKVSRTAGSGSIHLAYEDLDNGHSDRIHSRGIPVTPGKVYTFSAYVMIDSWPPPRLRIGVGFRDKNGTFTHNSVYGPSRWGVNQVGTWQEVVGFFYPKAGDATAEPAIMGSEPLDGDPSHDLWIDDVYFGEGQSFAAPPTPKTPFDGTMTRVDDLGNIEVQRNGKWVPFFPLCIYADGTRPDWSTYSKQGFNCNMWTSSTHSIQKGKDATSLFNPDGLLSGFDISPYLGHTGWAYKDVADLKKKIKEIRDANLMSSLLFWYWDNEHIYGDWENPVNITSAIIHDDVDGSGHRQHPIYALNGNFGLTRIYQSPKQTLIDLTGCYVDPGPGLDGLVVQDMVSHQPVPRVIAQIQLGIGEKFRPTLFAAIAKGARGMGHWRDKYKTEPVEKRAWWPQLPQIRRDIDAMSDLIRTPHWTDWSLSCDTHDDITVGTRTMNCHGYVIAANPSGKKATLTCHIKGLAYQPSKVVDFFTNGDLGTVTGDSFSLPIEAYGRTVVRLDE